MISGSVFSGVMSELSDQEWSDFFKSTIGKSFTDFALEERRFSEVLHEIGEDAQDKLVRFYDRNLPPMFQIVDAQNKYLIFLRLISKMSKL